MAASPAQRTVNIYPGLPRTGLINEEKVPSQHIAVPEESSRPPFLILCPHTCNPLAVLSHVINGFHPIVMADYHTAEARNPASRVRG